MDAILEKEESLLDKLYTTLIFWLLKKIGNNER